MPKAADIGGKRLISLAPEAWVRWVTGRSNVEAGEIVTSEFQWISRQSDVLVRASSPQHGDFLILNELQLRYTAEMPRRMRAYAALAEERYRVPVFPALINILPASPSMEILDRYESEFMGMQARQDYRVLNLWTVDVDLVFREPLPSLLPFVPVLKGGNEEPAVRQALQTLRTNEQLSELEPLLAFFASFVLETHLVQQIMRWDMTVLRESPWYQEILEEGLEKGRQEGLKLGLEQGLERGLERGLEQGLEQGVEQGLRQGAQRQLVRVIEHQFGSVPPDVPARLRDLSVAQLEALVEIALDADSLEEFLDHLATDRDNGRPAA